MIVGDFVVHSHLVEAHNCGCLCNAHARHVLLLLRAKKLPRMIGYQIYECFTLQAQPQMQRSISPASGTRRSHLCTTAAAPVTRGPQPSYVNEMD